VARKPPKHNDKTGRPSRQRRQKLPASGNRRLSEQTRKILGKHYASKYRVR